MVCTGQIEKQRGRDAYSTIASWLTQAKKIVKFESQTRDLIKNLYNHKPNLPALKDEFKQPYFIELIETLRSKKEEGERFFPPGELIFNAFNTTSVDNLKIVILGQDPYHGL